MVYCECGKGFKNKQARAAHWKHCETYLGKPSSFKSPFCNPKIQRENALKRNTPSVSLDDVLNGKAKMPNSRLRIRLIKAGYKPAYCERCKNDTWLGVPIPLELHHIDGNHDNNALTNLQILCPNCHSLTENYCSKNKKRT